MATPSAPPTKGFVIGHLEILAEERDVTKDCRIRFRDADAQEFDVQPDELGWVTTTLTQGQARISSVNCKADNYISTLDFSVSGEGRTTYFGHVRLRLSRTTTMPSPVKSQAIQQGMAAAPPTLQGTAVATAVGLLALFLLPDDVVAAGPAAVEVEDKMDEAAAVFRAHYQVPLVLVASLAGSTFSNEAPISPSLQKMGAYIYTQASVGGILVTWMADSNLPERKATLRVRRYVRKDTPCERIKLGLDGRTYIVPATSRTARASNMLGQTVRAELDQQAIRAIASAHNILVDVCGTTRTFSTVARGATINFANAYAGLQAHAAAVVSTPVASAPPESSAAASPAAATDQVP